MPWLKDIIAKEKRQTITEKQPPEKEYQKTFPYCDYLYAFLKKKTKTVFLLINKVKSNPSTYTRMNIESVAPTPYN